LAPVAEGSRYERLSLIELIQRIVADADHEALTELHENRRHFSYGNRRELRLVSYIDCLRLYGPAKDNRELSDRAYSLTIDKFTRLPDQTADAGRADERAPGTGVDCRNYYRAFLRLLYTGPRRRRRPTSLTGEQEAAWRLQGLVLRHFHLSLRECRRNGEMTRFTWKMETGELHLQMPRSIAGPERRKWLEANVPDCDPRRPGETARVQAIVDAQLKPVSFNDVILAEHLHDGAETSTRTIWFAPGCIESRGLAETVATEKAESVHVQRPAIRKLGADRLEELVRRTFASLDSDHCCDTELAEDFGLSKATFSRFAGSHWNGAGEVAADMSVPDLWINTARVVAREPAFVEVAVGVGVWRTVATVAGVDPNFGRQL